MPNWKEILNEASATGGTYDVIRRKYLTKLSKHTGRNVIAYYSGWLQKQELAKTGFSGFSVNDSDKTGFMSVIHQMDKSKGLDLILHTPGGEVAATESIMDYLLNIFDGDIRAIVPELAMSAGTMISLGCKEVIMGKHSSLGPIDPQFAGIPAHGVIEEFQRIRNEITSDPRSINLWQPILAKYAPTFVGECEKSIEWANEIVSGWLKAGMFNGDSDADKKIKKIINELGDHALQKSHSRHISLSKALDLGIKVVPLEDDDKLQESVLSVHHSFIQTLSSTGAYKMIENQNEVAFIQMAQQQIIQK